MRSQPHGFFKCEARVENRNTGLLCVSVGEATEQWGAEVKPSQAPPVEGGRPAVQPLQWGALGYQNPRACWLFHGIGERAEERDQHGLLSFRTEWWGGGWALC